MIEVIYRCKHHHVLSIGGKYQVVASATNYSCGFYDTKRAAVNRAITLSNRREAHDKRLVV